MKRIPLFEETIIHSNGDMEDMNTFDDRHVAFFNQIDIGALKAGDVVENEDLEGCGVITYYSKEEEEEYYKIEGSEYMFPVIGIISVNGNEITTWDKI
jgi:hypothetical protein